MTQDKKIDLSRFRDKFVQEARTRLARMNEGLVTLEKGLGDARLEEDILLEAHTLKGAARMLGFAGIAELTQRFEEALALRGDRQAPPARELLDTLFLALGTLSQLVESLSQPPREVIDVRSVLERLKAAQEAGGGPPASPPVEPKPAPRDAAGLPASAPEPARSHGAGEPGAGTLVEPERLERISNCLAAAISHQMRLTDLKGKCDKAEKPYRRMIGELLDVLRDGIRRGEISPALENRVAPLLEAGKSMYHDVFARVSELHRRDAVEAESLAQNLEDMRTEIMSIRMVPLSPLFDSLQPLAVSLARELGKDVEIRIGGGKTEIDRKVAEAIAEPLTQILRNAIDHGIEPPADRGRCGKMARGTIAVTATPRKGRVVIEVEDDGRGIDPQEIREAAVRQGLVTEKAARRLDDREVLGFLFRKGFSTAKDPSAAADRGIGLEAVRAAAEKFNGVAEVSSVHGKGTRVVLEFPFSMSVSRVILVLSAEQFFGIPAMYSEGIRRFTEDDVIVVEGRKSLCVDGAPVPLVWLNRLMGHPDTLYTLDGYLAVIVRHSRQRMALVVDRVEGESEVVVRDLGKYLGKIQLFMGSTILGTGDVVLLLDVYDLMAAVRLHAEPAPPGGPAHRGRPAAEGTAPPPGEAAK